MADTALRDAERALASMPSDTETYARWVAAHLRAGGRDPRRDPRPGDVVVGPYEAHRTVVGSWPMQTRSRVEAWGNRAELERALGRSLAGDAVGWAAPRLREIARVTLPEGTLVRWGIALERDPGRDAIIRSHYMVSLGREWVRVDGYYDVRRHLAQVPDAAAIRPEQTVYVLGAWSLASVRDIDAAYSADGREHISVHHSPARAIERSSWRRWARGGTVLRVAR